MGKRQQRKEFRNSGDTKTRERDRERGRETPLIKWKQSLVCLPVLRSLKPLSFFNPVGICRIFVFSLIVWEFHCFCVDLDLCSSIFTLLIQKLFWIYKLIFLSFSPSAEDLNYILGLIDWFYDLAKFSLQFCILNLLSYATSFSSFLPAFFTSHSILFMEPFIKKKCGAEEIDQQLKACTFLTEDQVWFPAPMLGS